MKKIILIFVMPILIITCSGCDRIIKSMDRTSIHYEGHQFNILLNWEMTEPDNYIKNIINNDNINLSIRLYKNDKNTDFIYCEDDSLLYHKAESDLPENKIKNIDYLMLIFHDPDKGVKKVTDIETIKNLINSNHKPLKMDEKSFENVASIEIYYKNFPACNFYGNIVVDDENQYWIDDSATGGYYMISDTRILDYI